MMETEYGHPVQHGLTPTAESALNHFQRGAGAYALAQQVVFSDGPCFSWAASRWPLPLGDDAAGVATRRAAGGAVLRNRENTCPINDFFMHESFFAEPVCCRQPPVAQASFDLSAIESPCSQRDQHPPMHLVSRNFKMKCTHFADILHVTRTPSSSHSTITLPSVRVI